MLEHLHVEPEKGALLNYKFRRAIASALRNIPYSLKLVSALKKIATHLNNIYIADSLTQQFSKRKRGGNAGDFTSGYGYESSFQELEAAEHYRSQIQQGNLDNQKTESGKVYAAAINSVNEIIKHDSSVKTVTNFGVCYAYLDSILAQKNPHIDFVGIDRSSITKFFNEQFFSLPNLSFLSGDIFDNLTGQILIHTRILVCLTTDFAERLYKQSHLQGIKYIVGVEQCGLSWETGKHYPFSIDEQESVVFRGFMFIHNYPGILKKCGYELIKSEIIKTNHPDPNFRLISFVAKAI